MTIHSIILAAGQGTRMKSALPKILHKVCGRSMIQYAINASGVHSTEVPIVVIGHGAEKVRVELGGSVMTVIQEQQLGTAHAVAQAKPHLVGKAGLVLVTYGDMPLLTSETLGELVKKQQENDGPISLITVIHDNPRGFGRIIRNVAGTVDRIVEEAQATPEQLKIQELNVGAYCFDNAWLWQNIDKIAVSPKGEYYLTDIVELAVKQGKSVKAVVLEDFNETIGVNNRVHLAEAEHWMRKRINQTHQLNGVTLIDPSNTYIDAAVRIGRDTVVFPNTHLRGSTEIGENCQIGPGCVMTDTKVGRDCVILYAVTESAEVEDDVEIGPYARLRKGAHLASHVHMGNFGEVKDSYLGEGVKMGHFSYIGNAEIGTDVNIGAGTITCNFDGKNKNKTKIGNDVFIGSDTMLVAPVTLGEGSRTGAGAVVTRDVEPNTLVVGVPAKPIKKLNPK